MLLNKQVIQCIKDSAEHHRDYNASKGTDEYSLLDQLYNLCNNVPARFNIKIEHYELVPETKDITINLIMKEILCLLDCEEEEAIDYENALWDYLRKGYNFNPEEHDLLKHTTEEAFSFAFTYLKIAL